MRPGGLARRIAAALLVVGAIAGAAAAAAPAARPDPLALLQARLKDKVQSVKAVLILRGGCTMFEFYKEGVGADTRLPLHSITKSVLSGLVGLAIDRGQLGLDQTLGLLLPEALAATLDPRVRTITVRQMLTMTAGFDAEAKPPAPLPPPPDGWRWALQRPLLSVPGRDFRYDNQNADMLSVILSRRTGRSAEALAQEMLFGPLDIRNYSWLADADGHTMGSYGLWLTARDMAKIGLLYLRHGRQGGRQVLPEGFVASATRAHNAGGTPFRNAYGYFWWVKTARAGPEAFFAAGSDGQLIYVVPKRDLVAVLASDAVPPGGSVAFMTDVILPAAALAPSCRPGSSGP